MSDVKDALEEEIKVPEQEPVVVNLDDAPADAPVVEKKIDEQEPAVDERDKALEELRLKLDEQKANTDRERQARERAENFARDQLTKVKTAEVEVQDSNLRTIVNAIDSVEQAAKAAVRAFADASANGDYEAAAEAQRSIARAESQLLQLNNGKRALEERLQARTAEGRVQDEEPPEFAPPQNSLETMAARLTPKSAEWLRAHPEVANNVSKLTAAHSAAVELEGIAVESPEYFAYIEQRLGITKPAASNPTPESKPTKSPTPSIPVGSGGGGARSGSGGSSITLSPSEVDIAILSEPNLPREKALEAYARNKMALIKEGRLK